MASFFRRLFGGGGSQAPQSAPKPKPKPAPAMPTGSSSTPAAAPGSARAGSAGRPKGKTIYTSSLGLTPEQRSGINLKSLTGA